MLVTIDESGCPGFKAASTEWLVISMVIFDNCEEATRCGLAIKRLRDDLKVHPEFHFVSDSNVIRDHFFKTVCNYDFKVRSILVKKSRIESHELRTRPIKFYNFIIKQLITHDNSRLKNASVKIDKKGKKERTKAFLSYLRSGAPPGKFKKIREVDSINDTLVQLADYVVGATARPHNSSQRKYPSRWRNMIASKIEDEWFFK